MPDGGEPIRLPDPDKIDRLVAHRAALEAVTAPEIVRNHDLAGCAYHPAIEALVRAFHDNDFVQLFDWTLWQPQAETLSHNPTLLQNTSLSDCVKLITTHVRKERFCSGHLGSMVQRGHIGAILRRLAAMRIEELLLDNRDSKTDYWGDVPRVGPWSKKDANQFLLCCLLDFQIKTETAWANGVRLVKKILGDPDDIWRAITSVSEEEWKSKWREYNLHRFHWAHNRLWRIGKAISETYDGDSRRIWVGRSPEEVLKKLQALGGTEIPNMIVGALRDCCQIEGPRSDVKGDVYVCRVLGRAVNGVDKTDPATAQALAREIHPADMWQIDAPLWMVGKSYCLAKDPVCSKCYLHRICFYSQRALRT